MFGCHIVKESPPENLQKWGFPHLAPQIFKDLVRQKCWKVEIRGLYPWIPKSCRDSLVEPSVVAFIEFGEIYLERLKSMIVINGFRLGLA